MFKDVTRPPTLSAPRPRGISARPLSRSAAGGVGFDDDFFVSEKRPAGKGRNPRRPSKQISQGSNEERSSRVRFPKSITWVLPALRLL